MISPILKNSLITLEFSPRTGALTALRSLGKDFIASASSPRPLFEMNFRDNEGNPARISGLDFPAPEFSVSGSALEIRFDAWKSLRVKARVRVHLDAEDCESLWHIEVEHGREGYLEWIEFPRVVVPNDLGAEGGKIFWPAFEGVLAEGLEDRENSWIPYSEIEYPNSGLCGYYPGVATFQFLAHESAGSVLYFGSHDSQHTTKEIEYCRDTDGARLIQKVYLDASAAGKHALDYPIVLSAIQGGWHAAAERYRRWIESVHPAAIRISERDDLPSWIGDSPVVVTYAVTGAGHHGGKTSPNEFFPFDRALPVLEKLGRELDSRLLVLLMHWEGTAPWSPPYVWPPLGGEEGLRRFADELHARNHLVGLYCSGTAWTNTTETGDGTYNRTEELERDGLIRHMCRGPRGEYSCKICQGGGLRQGYDICPSTDFARDVLAAEAEKIAGAGVDYIQLLDQNLGGAAYQCYDSAHGHPSAPGKWGARAMRDFLSAVRARLVAAGRDRVLLGCEGGAAEPYLRDLAMNDLRFPWAFFVGRPVPAYSYLFHEYGCNFMGNQCGVLEMHLLDKDANPENLAFRMAYSFSAGDLLTLVLKSNGEIHWGWCTKWDVPPPPQASHLAFARHLNAWRRGAGQQFLCGGRMLAPSAVEGANPVALVAHQERPVQYPAVLASRWQSPRGESAHFFVNFLECPQKIRAVFARQGREVCIVRNPAGGGVENLLVREGTTEFEIPGLSAVMVREDG